LIKKILILTVVQQANLNSIEQSLDNRPLHQTTTIPSPIKELQVPIAKSQQCGSPHQTPSGHLRHHHQPCLEQNNLSPWPSRVTTVNRTLKTSAPLGQVQQAQSASVKIGSLASVPNPMRLFDVCPVNILALHQLQA
jgi:hypothetical protein